MADSIQFRRGLRSAVKPLPVGMPGFIEDEERLVIGKGDGTNTELPSKADMDNINSQMADSAKQYVSATKPPLPYVGIIDGEDISDKLIALLSYTKTIANSNYGSAPIIIIPPGNYTVTKKIIIYTYQKLLFLGNSTINVVGLADACFQFKNDNLHQEGIESDYNNFCIEALGKLFIHGDGTAGGNAITLGNNDGDSLVDGSHYNAFIGFNCVNIFGFETGVIKTNNGGFAQRIINTKISNCSIGYKTTSGTLVNSLELDSFINTFINNNGINIQINNSEELSFINSSMDFASDCSMEITNGYVRIHLNGAHIERFGNVCIRNLSNSQLNIMSGSTYILPAYNSGNDALRKMFIGKILLQGNFQIYSATVNQNAEDAFICDDNVTCHANIEFVGTVHGLIQKNKNIQYDYNMSDTSQTTGFIFTDTTNIAYVQNPVYNENPNSLKLTGTGKSITSPLIQVLQGFRYHYELIINKKDCSAGGLSFKFNYYDENKNLLSSSSYIDGRFSQLSSIDSWFKSRYGDIYAYPPLNAKYLSITFTSDAAVVGSIYLGALYCEQIPN